MKRNWGGKTNVSRDQKEGWRVQRLGRDEQHGDKGWKSRMNLSFWTLSDRWSCFKRSTKALIALRQELARSLVLYSVILWWESRVLSATRYNPAAVYLGLRESALAVKVWQHLIRIYCDNSVAHTHQKKKTFLSFCFAPYFFLSPPRGFGSRLREETGLGDR